MHRLRRYDASASQIWCCSRWSQWCDVCLKTLGEADIISVSGIISKTTAFAEGKHHWKNSLRFLKEFFLVPVTGLEPVRSQWSRDFKSLVSAYSTTPAVINKNPCYCRGLCGDPDENRTRVTAVKGRCLNRLTTGPCMRGLKPFYLTPLVGKCVGNW